MQPKIVYTMFFTLVAVIFTLSPDTARAEAKFKVGIPLPLTGEGVIEFAQEIQHAFIVANEILGKGRFELIFEDDRCTPREAVTVVRKLLDLDRVNVITGGYCNSCLFSSAPLYNKAGIPVITLATTGDKRDIGPKIFRIFPSDDLGVQPLMAVVSQRTKKLCMVSELEPFTELVSRAVKKTLKAKYSHLELYSLDLDYPVSDYRPAFLKMSGQKCDGLLLNTTGEGPLVTAVKQYLESGSPIQMYALYFPGSTFARDELKEKLNGIIYSNLPRNQELATDATKEFFALYEKKFGPRETSQPLKLLTFEAFRLIVAAYVASKPLDQYLEKGKKISGGALRNYWFDEDGAVQGVPIRVFQYRDGKDVMLSESRLE
jgi:ABC-type branched-subunit amino acid transport system substrate-binding protein